MKKLLILLALIATISCSKDPDYSYLDIVVGEYEVSITTRRFDQDAPRYYTGTLTVSRLTESSIECKVVTNTGKDISRSPKFDFSGKAPNTEVFRSGDFVGCKTKDSSGGVYTINCYLNNSEGAFYSVEYDGLGYTYVKEIRRMLR